MNRYDKERMRLIVSLSACKNMEKIGKNHYSMLLAEEHLPTPGNLTTIQNLPTNLSLIISRTERMVSKDLAYNILHWVNSLANDLIRPSILRPASAPAPDPAILSLPPQVGFASSHI